VDEADDDGAVAPTLDRAHSRPMHCGHAVARHLILALIASLTMSGCLFIVSTDPTSITGATIVFVAVDDRGVSVPSLQVSVVGVDGTWRDNGLTASDGAFRCHIGAGVTRVRAGVTMPSGYVLVEGDRWPREIDVSPGESLQIEIRVRGSSFSG
jgi:hypothetical protein